MIFDEVRCWFAHYLGERKLVGKIFSNKPEKMYLHVTILSRFFIYDFE